MNAPDSILVFIINRFKNYKALADKTFDQLENNHFFYKPTPASNSIAIIIHHMYGNAMSRFTNFLTEDGEKPWRQRDEEFEELKATRDDLISYWNTGWKTVFTTIESLQPEDLEKTVYIRAEKHIAVDALLRQLAHYSYHIGQIVYLAKMQVEDFASLSIPKGESNQFNQRMRLKDK